MKCTRNKQRIRVLKRMLGLKVGKGRGNLCTRKVRHGQGRILLLQSGADMDRPQLRIVFLKTLKKQPFQFLFSTHLPSFLIAFKGDGGTTSS